MSMFGKLLLKIVDTFESNYWFVFFIVKIRLEQYYSCNSYFYEDIMY